MELVAHSMDHCAVFSVLVVGEDNKLRGGLGWFQAVDLEGLDMELDLSNLGTVNTMFAALFRYVAYP